MGIAVNANQTAVSSCNKENKKQRGIGSTNYQVGDIIQGTVAKVSNQISIQFNERTAEVDKKTLPNAKEGDVLNFKVCGIGTDGSMKLQYIEDSVGQNSPKHTVFTAVMKELKGQQLKDTNILEKEEDVANGEGNLKDINQKMTEEDYTELAKEGFSLKRFELERFDRALERIKTQRAEIEKSITSKIEIVKEKEEELKTVGLSSVSDPYMRQQIAQLLSAMNLPASKQNVDAVSNAVQLSSNVASLSDASMAYLLKNELEITPVNLYTAGFNAGKEPMEFSPSHEADWHSMSKQVEQLVAKMKESGMDVSTSELKWLYDRDLPIHEDMVTSYQALNHLKDNRNLEEIAKAIIKGMSEGKSAMDAVLVQPEGAMVERAIAGFASVTSEALQQVVSQGEKLNLSTLLAHTKQFAKEPEVATEKSNQDLQKELNLVTARRQLEEIRVKLTYEAGLKLVGKGINLQTDGLDQIVTSLRNQEQEYYQALLLEGGAKVTDSSVNLLRETVETREILSQSPSYVLGVRTQNSTQMTLASLAEDGATLSHTLRQVGEAYEPLMTAPRSDMGDSIQKAFANMDSFLQELGIEATSANQRAVRILAYNQMEINEASIENMKLYDAKVTSLLKELHPAVAVQLIKNKVNPLDTPVDELREYIKDIAATQGETKEEKYSTFLAKLQKNETLTEQERDTYIGIYRLFRQVEKSDGKAIGYLVNAGREITLNNLVSAVQTIKGKGVDTSVDQSFGTLEEVTYASKRIGEQMNAGFTGQESLAQVKTMYQNQVSDQVFGQLTPDFLTYAEDACDLMNASMEQLMQLGNEYQQMYPQTDNFGYHTMMQQVQEAMQMTNEMKFLRDHEVAFSVEKIKAASEILGHENGIYQKIEHACSQGDSVLKDAVKLIESSQSYTKFHETYEKVVNSLLFQLRETFEQPTLKVEDMIARNHMIGSTSLLQELSQSQYYQIPIQVSGQIVEVGLSIQSGTKEKGKLEIHMNSQGLGEIEAKFQLVDNELKGLIVCENKTSADRMSHVVEKFRVQLPKDLVTDQIHLCVEDSRDQYIMDTKDRANDPVQSERLFEIAKAFIQNIKEIED